MSTSVFVTSQEPAKVSVNTNQEIISVKVTDPANPILVEIAASIVTDFQNYYTKAEINALLSGDIDLSRIVENEIPVGAVNSSNATFTTQFNFVPATVAITINGLEQTPTEHYATVGTNTILFSDSPQTGDHILVDYIKQI